VDAQIAAREQQRGDCVGEEEGGEDRPVPGADQSRAQAQPEILGCARSAKA
jgi:hypothetical protein